MTRSDAPLFETQHGRVTRTRCGRLEISFLGERLRLSRDDFHTVAQTVERAWQDIQAASTPSHRWRLTAYTEAGEASVVVRAADIEGLRELLHGTSAMLELDALLQDVLYS